MIVTLTFKERTYEVELVWDRIAPVGWGWWLREIRGEPRPLGSEVAPIYREALDLARRALRSQGQS